MWSLRPSTDRQAPRRPGHKTRSPANPPLAGDRRGTVPRAVSYTHLDLDQAAEDLRREWSSERTPTWAIDTGLPAPDELTREIVANLAGEQKVQIAAVAHAGTKIMADALAAIRQPDIGTSLADTHSALQQAQRARADLFAGSGAYRDTDAGRAVAELGLAQVERAAAERAAENSERWRDRRSSAKHLNGWIRREAEAHQRWEALSLIHI